MRSLAAMKFVIPRGLLVLYIINCKTQVFVYINVCRQDGAICRPTTTIFAGPTIAMFAIQPRSYERGLRS
jgi:hypothetical protein